MGLVISPEERQHLLPQLGAIFLVLGAALAIFQYGPPAAEPRESMIAFEGTLATPVTREHTRRTSYWAKVTLSNGELRLLRLCDLWACELPRELSELKNGDILRGLRWDDEIVELRHNGIELLSYSQWAGARVSMRGRGFVVGIVLAAAGALSLILGLWIRRRDQKNVAQQGVPADGSRPAGEPRR